MNPPDQPEKLLTRRECSEILKSRGYVPADYPGVWIDPKGEKIAWFQAVCREKLAFDRKDKPWTIPHVNQRNQKTN